MRNKDNTAEISAKAVCEENLDLLPLHVSMWMEKAALRYSCLTSDHSETSQGLQVIPKAMGDGVRSQASVLQE